jgi:hypothetical protein
MENVGRQLICRSTSVEEDMLYTAEHYSDASTRWLHIGRMPKMILKTRMEEGRKEEGRGSDG